MLQQAQQKANNNASMTERRVKTAERTGRPIRYGFTSRDNRRFDEARAAGQKEPHSLVLSNGSLATTGPATTIAKTKYHEQSQPFSEGM